MIALNPLDPRQIYFNVRGRLVTLKATFNIIQVKSYYILDVHALINYKKYLFTYHVLANGLPN